MRLSPPLSVLLIITAALATLGVWHNSEQRKLNELRCEVTLIVARSLAKEELKQVVFENAPAVIDATHSDIDAFVAIPKNRSVLSAEQIELYHQAVTLSSKRPFDECPNLRAAARVRIINRGPPANGKMKAPATDADGTYTKIFRSISLPAISRDQKTAYFQSARYGAPDSGNGEEIFLTRGRFGRWKISKRNWTWVS